MKGYQNGEVVGDAIVELMSTKSQRVHNVIVDLVLICSK